MSARKPDPVLAAWERLKAADRADWRAFDALDKVSIAAQATGSRAGLARLTAAKDSTRLDWRAAMKAMATTRATTSKGVILKLKLVKLELRDGPTGFGEAIAASAIRDLSRIGSKR